MNTILNVDEENEKYFCLEMKKLICSGKSQEAIQIICDFMSKHPNSAIPHNLLGIIYEKKCNHILAMKHFRAAWCLDPTYLPARENMSNFSGFERIHRFFYEELDCSKSKQKYEIKYDSRHIGHVVEKSKFM